MLIDDKLFESAFKFASIGMAIVSLEGKWLKVNSSICEMLGYTSDELLNLDFQSLTFREDLEPDLKLVSALLEGSIESYQMEKRYIRKDGNITWGLLSVSLVKSDEGNPLFFISQVQDISSLKIAEDKLVQTEKLKTLMAFSIQIAHEVNNPLTIVSLCSDQISLSLEENTPDIEELKNSNKILKEATDRLAFIIKGMTSKTIDPSLKNFLMGKI